MPPCVACSALTLAHQIGPLEDAVSALSGWHAFSDTAKRDQERWATSPEDAGLAFAATPLPFVAPFKGVGHNDPCPCGLDRESLRPSLPGLLRGERSTHWRNQQFLKSFCLTRLLLVDHGLAGQHIVGGEEVA